MSDPIISLKGLEKSFGSVKALTGLTLDVPQGAVGLLGPNGSGKTTLIKLLLGLLRPTAGEAILVGCNPRKRADRLAVRRKVGYMPEGDCLLPGMTAVELVSTLGRITGLSLEDAMTRAHEVLDYVELEEARYRPLEEYSTGMKQRLKLAQALAHDPPLLLLDEPTNGLDPKGRRHMLELIHDLGHDHGKSVLLCSHLMLDVERTCDHVVVLNRGAVVRTGAIADMTSGDGLRLRLQVTGALDAFESALAGRGYMVEQARGEELTVLVPATTNDAPTDADAIFAVAAETGTSILGVDEVRSTLEQVFLEAVGGKSEA